MTDLVKLPAPRDRSVPIVSDVNAMYDEFKKWVENEEITANNLITLVTRAMRLAEVWGKRSGDHGAAKAEIVMQLIERVIDDSDDLSDDGKQTLHFLVDTLVPPMMSALVDADHGQLFAHARSTWKRVAGCCTGQ